MSHENVLDGWVIVQVVPDKAVGVAINIHPLPDYVLSKLVGELNEYSDGKCLVIGRGPDCQIRPDSMYVSRRHCALVVGSKGVIAIDLGSRNGFWHNDIEIGPCQWVVINDGDTVAVPHIKWSVQRNVSDANLDPLTTHAT